MVTSITVAVIWVLLGWMAADMAANLLKANRFTFNQQTFICSMCIVGGPATFIALTLISAYNLVQ